MTNTIALVLVFLLLSASGLGQGPIPQKAPAPPKASSKQEPEPQSGNTRGAASSELTAADLDAFLDGVVPLQLKQNDIAGATVAVV